MKKIIFHAHPKNQVLPTFQNTCPLWEKKIVSKYLSTSTFNVNSYFQNQLFFPYF